MLALATMLGLSLFPLSHATCAKPFAADKMAGALAIREDLGTESISVTVTADWLFPPDPTDDPSTPTESTASSSLTWWSLEPSEPTPTPSSTRTGGCRPFTSHWPNNSLTTLVTTRPVTITTVVTEPWSTATVEITRPPIQPTKSGWMYPVPTWTRCPYAGGGDEADMLDGEGSLCVRAAENSALVADGSVLREEEEEERRQKGGKSYKPLDEISAGASNFRGPAYGWESFYAFIAVLVLRAVLSMFAE